MLLAQSACSEQGEEADQWQQVRNKGRHGESCRTSNDCRKSLACVDGTCLRNEYDVEPTSKSCTLVECTTDRECCRSDASCDAHCRDYTCVPGERCESDEDCGSGVCRAQTGACVECTSDTHCETGEYCDDNECLETCRTDSQCPLFEACQQGECVETGCRSDRACIQLTGDPEARCRSKTGECIVPCHNDAECNDDGGEEFQVCKEGRCVFAGCKTDPQCRAALDVSNTSGRVRTVCGEPPPMGGTEPGRDAGDAGIVDGGRDGETPPPDAPSCSEDVDCPGQQICDRQFGRCTPPECAIPADCPGGQTCRDSRCVPGCRGDGDCDFGETCDEQTGRCVPESDPEPDTSPPEDGGPLQSCPGEVGGGCTEKGERVCLGIRSYGSCVETRQACLRPVDTRSCAEETNGQRPYCDNGECVECYRDRHCAGERRCENRTCVAPPDPCAVGDTSVRCSSPGSIRCTYGDDVERCSRTQQGCLKWEQVRDCDDTAPFDKNHCADGKGCVECTRDRHCQGNDECRNNTCVPAYQPDTGPPQDTRDPCAVQDAAVVCATPGATRCVQGTDIERCVRTRQGCLRWRNIKDCSNTVPFDEDRCARGEVCVECTRDRHCAGNEECQNDTCVPEYQPDTGPPQDIRPQDTGLLRACCKGSICTLLDPSTCFNQGGTPKSRNTCGPNTCTGDAGMRDTNGSGDAGQSSAGSWTTLSDVPASDTGPVKDMEFISPQKIWLAVDDNQAGNNGGFYYSNDGGQSWKYRKRQISASTFEIVNNGNKLIGIGYESGPGYYGWTSTDGKRWKPISDNVWERTSTEAEHAVFWSDQTGILANAAGTEFWRTTTGLSGNKALEYYNMRRNLPANGNSNCLINDMETFGSEIWVAGGDSLRQAPNGGACVFQATKKGKPSTWEKTYLKDNKHGYSGGDLEAVHVVSKNEIWVAGENRQLYKTIDGGKNWTQIGGFSQKISGFLAMDGQGDHMFLAGKTNRSSGAQEGVVLETTDGGQTWNMLWPNSGTPGPVVNEIAFVNKNLAYAWNNSPGGTVIRWSR